MQRWVLGLGLACAVATATAAAQSTQKHFLWAVRVPDGPPTYLMGSLHVLTPDYYPLNARIEQAFAQSKVLIEEVDMDELTNPSAIMPLMAKAVYTDGRTLDQVISPELYKTVLARAEKAGIPGVAVQRMKPWMVAVSLTAPALKAAGFDANLGVDKHFFDKAKICGPRAPSARDAWPTSSIASTRCRSRCRRRCCNRSFADIDTQLGNVKTIADAWARGDTSGLEKDLLGAFRESPELFDRLLAERNRNWVAPVEACLKAKTACFVVVGAAHLVGPDSLVDLLQKKGYTVEQQ